jgi:hypothetical protein
MAGLNEAVKAALKGPERKDIKIRTHGFNVKRSDKKVVKGETHIWGQISHRLSLQPDDQVFYEIVTSGGKIKPIKRTIKGGGWSALAGKAAAVLGGYFGVPIPPDVAEDLYKKVEKLVVGDWVEACDVIIAAIALEVV